LLEEYDPQGIEQNIRLPGQYHDRETDLYYNYHRYYDPKIEAYISQDPIGLRGGVNLYQYVLSSPTNTTDSEGLILPLLAVIGAGTLAVRYLSSTYANLKSASIYYQVALNASKAAHDQQIALDEFLNSCRSNPSSNLSCSNTALISEAKKGIEQLNADAWNAASKYACLTGTSVPDMMTTGPAPAGISDLAIGGAVDLALPDSCP
jgi:RHS repeat-associated protein